MKISGSTALVTGANRGLGLAFARALLEAGASKVYAGARDPGGTPPGVAAADSSTSRRTTMSRPPRARRVTSRC